MKRVQHLTIGGVSLLLAGIAMIASGNIGIGIVKVLIPILFINSGIFSILFANANPEATVPYRYQMMHGVGLMLFGIVFGLIPESLGDFLYYATYFILLFGLLEITMGFALVSSTYNFKWRDIVVRFFAGLFGLIGAVLILATSATDQTLGLIITGVVTVLIGIGLIVFSTKVKGIAAQ